MSLGLGLTRAKNNFTPDSGDDDPCLDPGCEEGEVWNFDECECECEEVLECDEGKTWDEEECACVCTEKEECGIGFEWNPVSCRCERR